ncbi:MAG: hypothetical protein Kow0090_08350 [Myxococcota bacterium]
MAGDTGGDRDTSDSDEDDDDNDVGMDDDAFLFLGADLDESGSGIYAKLLPFTQQANTIYYADVQCKTKEVLFPERFSLSSPPLVPPGLIPRIRDINSCL